MNIALLFMIAFTCVGIALSHSKVTRIALIIALGLLLLTVYASRDTTSLPQIGKPLQSTVTDSLLPAAYHQAIDKLRNITHSYP